MKTRGHIINSYIKQLMDTYTKVFKKVYRSYSAWVTTFSVSLSVMLIYYFILLQTATWSTFWESNIPFYNYSQIFLSLVNAVFIGVAITMFIAVLEERKKDKKKHGSILETLGALVYSVAATGCTVCGAILLPTLGVAASLTALPLGGLEVKFLSSLILLYSLNEYAKTLSGACKVGKDKSKRVLEQLRPVGVVAVFVLVVYMLPKLPNNWKVDFRQKQALVAGGVSGNIDADSVFLQINPREGYDLNVSYGDLGPKMVELGVIDLEKFQDVYENAGQPLGKEQLKILTEGSQEKIKITPENSYFLLNFFWAFGLANKNKILTEGEITKYGQDQVGNFASTGGWSLTRGDDVMDYYAIGDLIALTPKQQQLVDEVSGNVYRPCCNNPTSFPDCNHGMALLGVLELMAASGATEKEMYEAAKFINAYWFPSNYYDLAIYFKAKDGKDFADIDGKVILGRDYSSVTGWQNIKNWLSQNGYEKEVPRQGGGCGV